jgi:micrococcal nuclease
MSITPHFTKYSKSTTYANLQAVAKKQKIGLWSNPNATPPWLFRKARKSN